jgi:hypothetical protein
MRSMKSFPAICARAAAAFMVAGMMLWCMCAIYSAGFQTGTVRAAAAGLFGLATVCCFSSVPNRRRTLACFLVAFTIIAVLWTTIQPSNRRDWQADVAVLPWATIQGPRVTLHNIRNFTYRTEADFTPGYYDKTFDTAKLSSVDLLAVYWMGDAIAHIMLSFGFGGSDYVIFSIETRKEKNEAYSSIKGFFKQYELIYVVGDERDLIRVRTDYRSPQEDVYLYRLRIAPEGARLLFLEYVQKINQLRGEPEFYNTLTANCTTDVVGLARALGGDIRYSWKVLLSGYAPQYVYELGKLDTRMPFPELRRQSLINRRAHEVGDDPAFSVKIRQGLPGADGR